MSWAKHLIPGYTMTQMLKVSVNAFKDSDSKTTTELQELAKRAEIESVAMQIQAKVEQELAIAKRIFCAQEVEIEEFFDASGSGKVGVKSEGEALFAGASGEGRKITRRVIRFKGFNEEVVQDLSVDVEEIAQ